MKALVCIQAPVALLDRDDVDTDAILPKQYMKSIARTGFGPHAFDDWRYLDPGELGCDNAARRLNQDFPLNLPRYQGAGILLTGSNFGCGSSREHAVWALAEYGFRVIIARSFADIFRRNCMKNGVLTVVLAPAQMAWLMRASQDSEGYGLTVDLAAQRVTGPDGFCASFDIAAAERERLLNGWDDIDLSLRHAERIRAFEATWKTECPWVFAPPAP